MRYVSTRGCAAVSAPQAISRGLAEDGGLYVPERFPQISPSEIEGMTGLRYPERSARVLTGYLAEFDARALTAMCEAAYARFEVISPDSPVPLVNFSDGEYVMELFHGPTLAFKDVALTLLPHLLADIARREGRKDELLILVATSGDTGKAALSGFANVPGVRCAVFYPHGGVSEAQRLQMVTQAGENAHVIAVRGNFDQAQAGVKRVFTDPAAREAFARQNRALSSANSINFGRLAPQIAYYFAAYADLLASGEIQMGDALNFCVPTGNFGNILAAAYAKEMGLPVGRLICASNVNNVLTEFINTGEYRARRPLRPTTSPSMDILISSNLERMLYEIGGREHEKVRGWMDSLRETGGYRIDEAAHARLRELMWGGWAGDEAAGEEIARCWRERRYLLDPHTAIATRVLRDYRAQTEDMRPCVVTATASPFKFGRAVAAALLPGAEGDDFALCRALGDLTGLPVPEPIASLPSLPVRHTAVCAPERMLDALMELLPGV